MSYLTSLFHWLPSRELFEWLKCNHWSRYLSILSDHPNSTIDNPDSCCFDKGLVMKESSYRVLFNGSIEQGRDIDQVIANLSFLFKKDNSKIEHFFSGRPVLVKKNTDLTTANKYKYAFLNAGAICSIMPENTAFKIIVPQKRNPTSQFPPKQFNCFSSSKDGLI